MRVMVIVKATEDSEQGIAPTAEALEAFAAMDKFTEELVEAGRRLIGRIAAFPARAHALCWPARGSAPVRRAVTSD